MPKLSSMQFLACPLQGETNQKQISIKVDTQSKSKLNHSFPDFSGFTIIINNLDLSYTTK